MVNLLTENRPLRPVVRPTSLAVSHALASPVKILALHSTTSTAADFGQDVPFTLIVQPSVIVPFLTLQGFGFPPDSLRAGAP